MNDERNFGSDKPIHSNTGDSIPCVECNEEHVRCNSDDGERSDDGGSARSFEGGEIVALPTRRTKSGISRSHVTLELQEHIKDLVAFKGAYHQIHSRVLEVQDAGRLMKLVNWSGTAAVMGSLELTIHAIERTVDELKDLLKRIDAGAIIDSDLTGG